MNIRKYVFGIVFLLVVVVVLGGTKVLQIRSMMSSGQGFTPPPETVSSAEAKKVRWDTSISAVGTVAPVRGVLVSTEVAGRIKAIQFDSGGIAREGDLLVELDTSTEEAQLRTAVARGELSRASLARARDLRKQGILAQSDLDAAEATARQNDGEIDAIQSTIAKKSIRAPFSGKLGIRQAQLGQYVDVGAPIVPLQSLDPVYVDFSLPEQQTSRLKAGQKVRVSSDAVAGRQFDGVLTAVNPQVDPSTRNVKLQATLHGTGGALLPGMFAQVSLSQPEIVTPLVVPVTAVVRAPYGDAVFVLADVKDEKSGKVALRARMTTVRLGETRGDFVVIETGLEAGQIVATSGVFKLRNGSEVVINNELAPPTEMKPKPAES